MIHRLNTDSPKSPILRSFIVLDEAGFLVVEDGMVLGTRLQNGRELNLRYLMGARLRSSMAKWKGREHF